jgi:UDP-GlcNAc:undecaprenyl-phosphate GlcNAc-1-phosphate transferase
MEWIIVGLGVVAMVLSTAATRVLIGVSVRVGALDTEAIAGQVKEARRAVPNTGGIAIAAAVWVPMLAGLIGAMVLDPGSLPGWLAPVRDSWGDLSARTGLGWVLLVCVLVLHVLGVVDDRRPMGAMGKLVVMVVPAVGFVWLTDSRLLTLMDPYVGGAWLSVVLTVVWIVMVTNAMNFIDNMDGLSAGIAAIAGGLFLVGALMNAQWFVGVVLALLVGGCVGFLVFNFPPARVFMGDGGSLVIGFVLAAMTVRTTYIAPGAEGPSAGAWYAVLMPIAVLAVPLYDFVSVTMIRITQGKSPFKGDLQHFSHRIRERGLSGRATILVIYALTACTGISGIVLTRAGALVAVLMGVQIVLLLAAIALFEYKSARKGAAHG